MNTTQDIVLKLTIEEANLILEALGNLPFVRVYPLIAKIQTQGRSSQTQPTDSETEQNNGHLTIKAES